ncbi:type II toxin-antitoxin system HicB family antitoxin [Actinomycetospora sp. OC33-EN08]|uniref:Type II toxin-antitoxin system HicB family antitoxin n=1 Tax=Actinomycetospora aurantiaca TaxID=3129233 RepID=A0ABU8ML31_9PSEU
MTTYTARATRDNDRYWLVHIPELGHYTQARTVSEIETMARDLIVTLKGLEPDAVDLEVDIQLPGTAQEHLERVETLRTQEAEARRAAAAEARAAAAELKRAGLSLRDIGKLLGVSFQRASQLTSDV